MMKSDIARARLLMVAALAVIGSTTLETPSVWASENVVVPDGPQAGQLWDPSLTPYIVEPLDMMAQDSPVNEIAIRKSAQTGFTMMGLAASAYMMVNEPCKAMFVQPTQGALHAFNKEKLMRVIEQSPAIAAVVRDQTSRSGDASTTFSKQYPGGSLMLALASSSADLRGRTVRWVVNDEVDEYPKDLNGQGSPLGMIAARQEAFLVSGDWKRCYISTPTILEESEIQTRFEDGDQRYWMMPCPACGEDFHFEFDREAFRFNDTYPFEAHYVTKCCGGVIESHQKNRLIKTGKWVPTASRPGAYPSYHFDALTSPFVPFDVIAQRYIEARDNPSDQKTFHNLTLGLPYENSGDAPDHERLFKRRDKSMASRIVPNGGVILVGGADVQGNGIYVHVKAYGPGGQSYVIDADFLEGDTTDHRAGAFAKLEEYQRRDYKFEAGGRASAIRFPIDAGFRTHVVYGYVRDHVQMGAMAIKGDDGWNKPSLGAPRPQDVNLHGKRIRKGVQLYSVGTWPLKGVHYSNLRKDMLDDGDFPHGYVHFSWGLPLEYFKQITGEYLAEETHLGRIRRIWKPIPGKENHWLDCTIYSDAVADGHLGLNALDEDDWRDLAAEYGVGLGGELADEGLFTPPSAKLAKGKSGRNADEAAPREAAPTAPRPGFTSSHRKLF